MSDLTSTPSLWLEALIGALDEFALVALGLECDASAPKPAPTNADLSGASVDITAGDVSVRVGFLSTAEGRLAITRAFLAFGPDEESPPEELVQDVIREIINVLAGGVKQRMTDTAPGDFWLGIPHELSGMSATGTAKNLASTELKLGGVPARLVTILEHRVT